MGKYRKKVITKNFEKMNKSSLNRGCHHRALTIWKSLKALPSSFTI